MYLWRMEIQIARRTNAKLRLGMSGVSGGGKTMSALMLAGMFGKRVGLIDSEKGSASLYAGEPGIPEFSVIELESGAGLRDYQLAISKFAHGGFDVLVIDGLSLAWAAALEAVDRGGGWIKAGKVVSPELARLTQAMLSYPGHVIATMRSKTEYLVEKDDKTGKNTMTKMGLAPQVRGDTEYEFTVVLDLTREGTISVSKSRCGDSLPMDRVYDRNTELTKIGERLKGWLSKGAPISLRSEALERIKFASDLDALSAVVPWLKAEAAARPLTEAERDELKTAITQKKAALMDDVVPE